MHMRPLIGLNMSLSHMEAPLKAKAFCHVKYIDAVALAGGIPIIIPPFADRSMLAEALENLDGFCLIGGPDYLPSHYGGHGQPATDLMPERRHQFDLWLADALLDRTTKPVLGICGGLQLINIARGGALVQDIRSEWTALETQATTLQHSDDERKGSLHEGSSYRHTVKLAPGSLAAKVIGAKKLDTNSYHHQAIAPDRLGSGLKVTGWAPDGVIEVIEGEAEARFLLGVQWHPERQTDETEHLALFKALVGASSGTGGR